MAEEKRAVDGQDEGEANAKPSASGFSVKTMVLMGVIFLLLVGGSVGGTLFLLNGDSDEEEVAESSAEVESPEEDKKTEKSSVKEPALYFPLNPPFIVNFESRGRQRYLQADVTVMARETEVISAVQTHMPLIRNRLVMLYSGQSYENLQTDEGRQQLHQQTLEAIQQILQQEMGRPGVENILFTNFVMQ